MHPDPDPVLADVLAAQHGTLTWAQATRFLTDDEVRARVDRGSWVRVHRGVYRPGPRGSVAQDLQAARLALGLEPVACFHTAARLHGFGVVDDGRTHVLVPTRALSRGRLALHHDDPGGLVRVRGSWCTPPARTAVDLARVLLPGDGLAVLDAALAGDVVHPGQLTAELDRRRGARGVVRARLLVELADGRAQSPMESRTRWRCHEAGLPVPTPQLLVTDGRRRAFLDLGWEQDRVGLELDSLTHHGSQADIARDADRHNWLRRQGWDVYRATTLQVLRRPDELTVPVAAALSRRR